MRRFSSPASSAEVSYPVRSISSLNAGSARIAAAPAPDGDPAHAEAEGDGASDATRRRREPDARQGRQPGLRLSEWPGHASARDLRKPIDEPGEFGRRLDHREMTGGDLDRVGM